MWYRSMGLEQSKKCRLEVLNSARLSIQTCNIILILLSFVVYASFSSPLGNLPSHLLDQINLYFSMLASCICSILALVYCIFIVCLLSIFLFKIFSLWGRYYASSEYRSVFATCRAFMNACSQQIFTEHLLCVNHSPRLCENSSRSIFEKPGSFHYHSWETRVT